MYICIECNMIVRDTDCVKNHYMHITHYLGMPKDGSKELELALLMVDGKIPLRSLTANQLVEVNECFYSLDGR